MNNYYRCYHLRELPSSRPDPWCILSMCFDSSPLSLNLDAQYGHDDPLLSLLVMKRIQLTAYLGQVFTLQHKVNV